MKRTYRILIFILAYCSINYQLILSQLLSISVRNSYEQYNLSIAIYLFSMGLGSLFYDKTKNHTRNFIKTEILLSIVGLFLAPLLFHFNNLLNYLGLAYQFNYLFLILVGYLTGKEIPLVVNLSKDSWGSILFYDFFGSFLAYLLFGTIFYQSFNIIEFTILTASLNFLVLSVYLIINYKKYRILSTLISLLVFLVIFMFKNNLIHYSETIYLKGFY